MTQSNNAGTSKAKKQTKGLVTQRVALSKTGEVVKLAYESGRRVPVSILSTIFDRYEGTTHTDKVWQAEINLPYLIHMVRAPETRQKVAEFFLSNALVNVMDKIIPVATLKPDDVVITRGELSVEIGKIVGDVKASSAVMEILCSALHKVGIISSTGDFASKIDYKFGPVTVENLKQDAATQEILAAIQDIKTPDLATRKYSKKAFADELAHGLYSIGQAFLDINDMSKIFNDIVTCIRARFDHGAPSGMSFGTIDAVWRNHPVIEDLSKNMVFLDAAFSMNVTESTPLRLESDNWKLDKWLPVVAAKLRSSPRYAIVGREEILRTMNSRKVRDLRGRPVSSVVWRSACPENVAQAVFVTPDLTIDSAVRLNACSERMATVLAAGYGNTNGMGTDAAAAMLHSIVSHTVENGYDNAPIYHYIDIGDYSSVDNYIVAAMLSERVDILVTNGSAFIESQAKPEKAGNEISNVHLDGKMNMTEIQPKRRLHFVYTVRTDERDVKDSRTSGYYEGDSFVTAVPGEVFLMAKEFSAVEKLAPRPQLFPTVAFTTRLISFDEKSVVQASERYPYSVLINGTRISGAFTPGDIGSMDANPRANITVPRYNKSIFEAVESVYAYVDAYIAEVAKKLTGKNDFIQWLRRDRARHQLRLAQCIAPALRSEIHRGIIARAAAKIGDVNDSIDMKARLAQRSFGAYADIVTFAMFLRFQGIIDDTSPVFYNPAEGSTLVSMLLELESDRESLKVGYFD